MRQKNVQLLWLGIIGFLLMINPLQWLSILILLTALLWNGYRTYGNAAILLLILARPTLDILRTVGITIQQSFISGTMMIGLLTLCWGGYVLFTYRQIIWNDRLLRTMMITGMCFLSIAGASTLWSFFPIVTMTEVVHLMTIGIAFLVGMISIKTRQVSLHRLLELFLISGTIPVLIGLWQLLSGDGITTFSVADRVYATFAHPNVFAMYLILLMGVCTLHLKLHPMQHRRTLLLYLGVCCILLITTYTRAAWIGAAIFTVVYGLFHHPKHTIILCATACGAYLSFFPINQLVINTTNTSLTKYQAISRVFERDEEADSVAWRMSVVSDSIDMVRDQPLLGFGYGTFPHVWEIHRDPSFRFDDSSEAHNDYLRLLVETGGIGLMVYFACLGFVAWQSLRTMIWEKTHKGYVVHTFLISFSLTYMALSISDNMLNHTAIAWTIWLIWGALLATKFDRDHFLA